MKLYSVSGCSIMLSDIEFDCKIQYFCTGDKPTTANTTIEHIAIVDGDVRYDADYLLVCEDLVSELKHQIEWLEQ